MAEERHCRYCGLPLIPGAIGNRCPQCLLGLARQLALDGFEAPAAPTPGLPHFGDYELLEEIARGSMGVVYRVRQVKLNRIVAVKTLLSGLFAHPEFRQRFRIEAEAAANLHHPNIIAIHEFGEHQGQPYFSMDYVPGRSLADLTRDKPLPGKPAARYTQIIAQAVHYAHQHGILHRDLKPSNILIDADDQPRLTDFGLAKRLAEHADLTLTGQTLGSPAYMPPEQAAGQLHLVGPRSDVYALGAVFYHLLTGRPPFVAETLTAVLRQVQESDPVAPRLLNSSIPPDLEVLCLKCLEKEPGRRFASAQELADELGRFLQGEPIRTRPIGWPEKVMRWCRRKPTLATAVGLAVVLGLVVVLGAPLAIWRINQERHAALRSATEEARQHELANAALHRIEIQRVHEMFANDQAAGAVAILASLLRRQPTDRAVAEWLMNELTYRSFARPVLAPLQHDDQVFSAQFSPDGCRILTVSRNQSACLWEAATGQQLTPLLQHDRSLVRSGEFLGPTKPLLAWFNRDGTRIVTASIDHTAVIWDATTGQALGQPLRHAHGVNSAQFSPDNTLVATAGEDGKVQLWEADSGAPFGIPLQHSKAVNALEFSPDGQRILTASDDRTARVWNLSTGQPVGKPMTHQGDVRAAAFSPDGRRVVTGSADTTARIWSARTGEPLTDPLRHDNFLNSVQFSPDGLWVLTSSHDKTARLWNSLTGQLAGPPLKHNGVVRSAVFSPDGYRIVTASEDKTARVWDLHTGQPLTEPLRHNGAVWSAQFSPDGQRVITASSDQTAQVWDVRPGQALARPLRVGSRVHAVQWSGNGSRLLLVAARPQVRTPADGERHGVYVLHSGLVTARLSTDGLRVVSADEEGTVVIWDARSGETLLPPMQHQAAVNSVRFSPDGRWVATASADHTARIWDAQTGIALGQPLQHADVVYQAEFSPDGRWLVTAAADKAARIWDPKIGNLQTPPLQHQDEVVAAQFSPDGQLVLTASKDHTARVWNAQSGQPQGEPLRHQGPVLSARFSPDGRYVVTASSDNTARVWDARTGLPLGEPIRHEAAVNEAEFSADSARVVTASSDGTARIWDRQSGQPCGGKLTHEKSRVNGAQLSPDGHWLATAGPDVSAHVREFVPAPLPIPDWLPDLAEAVTGQRINAQQSVESVSPTRLFELKERFKKAPAANPYVTWAEWLLADRVTRRPSANSTVNYEVIDTYDSHWYSDETIIAKLWTALRYLPDDEVLASALARQVAEQDPRRNPHRLAEADWLSRRALVIGPSNPEAWWARAIYLEATGDLATALEVITQGAELGPENFYVWRAKGLLEEKAGHIQQAYEALTQAITQIERRNRNEFDLNGVAGFIMERARFLERQGRWAEARQDVFRAKGISPRAPQTPTNLIDLSPVYNAGLNNTWTDSRHVLHTLPRGRPILAGVDFDIRGLVQLSSLRLKLSYPDYPEKIQSLAVRQRCRRLHFLHAVIGSETEGTAIGRYSVHYANGLRQEIPIVYGQDVAAWNREPPRDRQRPLVAWHGQASDGLGKLLFKSTWTNPQPDTEIESIDFVSNMTSAAPFLVAITAEP